MEVRYQREAFSKDLYDELMPLLQLHWAEIARFKDIPLNPVFDKYLGAEHGGMLRIFTARIEETDELIGYNVFFIAINPHYGTSLQANQDVVFVRKDKRGFGLEFIAWCDEQLRYDRVDAVYHHVKAAHNFGPALEKLGYELVDLIYGRRLGSKEQQGS